MLNKVKRTYRMGLGNLRSCRLESRWIFKIKRTPEGLVDKYKARLVAQGFSQILGVPYGGVFASTARFAAVRTVFALAVIE